MADIYSQEKRSEIMSRIRSKNTQIELRVFRFLRKNKIYFQKHYSRVIGNPDIALPSKRLAVFLDGDFWHGRDFSRRESHLPEFWRKKILANIARDKRNRKALRRSGWKILRVWESDLERRTEKVLEKISNFLS